MSLDQKSTVVRSNSLPGLAVLRAGFRALDRVAPRGAARLATRLWCTPPPAGRTRRPAGPAAPPGERFLTPLAAAPEWASRPVWRPRRGRQFAVPVAGRGMVLAEVWGEGPASYLLHGWGGSRNQLDALVEPLVAAGQRVVALDAPGHGESGPGRLGGRRTTLVEFAEALTAVVAVTGPAHAVVAHSAGANATGYAVRRGLAADRLVLVAPMADPMPYLHFFAQTLGIGPRTWPRLLRNVQRLVGGALAEFDLPARIADLATDSATDPAAAGAGRRLPELLVVHDRTDRESRHAGGQALAASWPGAKLLSTDGLGHRRILAHPEVVNATVSFITAEDRSSGDRPGAVREATAAGSSRRS